MFRHLASLSIVCALGLFAQLAQAAVVTQVKGDQVLIDLQGDSTYAAGGRYLLMVGDKKKAVVEISRVKGTKALGKVLKGAAQVDGTLAPLPGAGAAGGSGDRKQARSRRSKKGGSAFSQLTYGALVGYASTSQSVNIVNSGTTETVSMSGSSLSLKAFGDMPISGSFGVIGRAGFENFGVTGTSVSLGSVQTKILYLSADLLLRYHFLDGAFKVFPLAGLGLHYPLSKSSDVLDVQRISATTIFFLGGGLDYSLSSSMYIRATAEYGLFPPSNDVKTSLIAVRAGLGFTM